MISTIVIKTIRACNLRCNYCYYINSDTKDYGLSISPECVATLYAKYAQYSPRTQPVDFIWHGGEPLMLGKRRFRNYLEQQKDFFSAEEVRNGIQTNGTLLDEEWMDIFDAHNVNVGISIDGPPDVQNRSRPTAAGKPSYEKVLSGIQLLKRHKRPVHILMCINPALTGRKAMAFLRELDVDGCDFLLPMTNHALKRIQVDENATVGTGTSSGTWIGKFLCAAFRAWVEKNDCFKVRLFEDLIRCAFGIGRGFPYAGPSTAALADVVVLETDGALCLDVEFGEIDRYGVGEEYKIGLNLNDNVNFHTIEQVLRDRIGTKRLARLPDACQPCHVRSVCRASHPGSRYDDIDGTFNHKSAHCDAMYSLCTEIVSYVSQMGLAQHLAEKRLSEYARHL